MANGSVGFGYDTALRVSNVTVNGQPLAAYTYDRDGLLTGAGAMSVVPDAVTGLLSSTILGGVTDNYTWSVFGELDLHSASHNGSLLYQEDVDASQQDERGRIHAVTEDIDVGGSLSTRTRGYSYDLAGRLEYVFENGSQVRQYGYDPNGNRTSLVTPTGTVVGHYDRQDRLTQYCPEDGSGAPQVVTDLPCASYAYNANGQLTARDDMAAGEQWTYDYDELGGLRAVTSTGGVNVTYELDAAGRRVGKYVGGVAQKGWLYLDGLNPVAELDGNGNVVSTFVYGTKGHVPDYMLKGGVTYRIVTDHLGSVVLVVNVADGSVAQRMEYDEFGRVLVDTAPGFQPFGFAGGLWDASTGLVRFGARDYDAVVGRWTAKDPILFGGGDADLYTYCGSDPVQCVDPTGKVWWIVGSAVAGAAVSLGTQLYYNGGDLSTVNYGDVASGAVIGAVLGSGLEFAFGAAFSATSTSGGLVAVTQWGAKASPWVMLGGRPCGISSCLGLQNLATSSQTRKPSMS